MERSRSIVGQSWFAGVKLAVATGIAYFIAGRLGLVLRVEPGLAIFWPASGISVGALIALGPRARLPVAAAVFVASTACGLTIGRNTWLSIAFGFLNTVQPLLTAWLLEQWFGRTVKLEDVRRVLGFFTATAVGSAIAAAGAVVTFSFIKLTVHPLEEWGLWFAASSLGVVTVAPLLIGLDDAIRDRFPRHELMEGWAGLIALTALTAFLISLPDGPWATALPEGLVFPFLLWVAIRCRPVFAAGAALVVGLTVIGSTALNVGYFDSGRPLADRILAAQTFVFIEAILVVLLAAVFAERRRAEQAVKHVAERLQLALDGAALGAFSADLPTGRLECDARAAQIHGHDALTMTIKESRRFVHPDDRVRIDTAVAEAKASGGRWNAEYRVLPPPGHPHAGETRWIAVDASVMRDRRGTPVGLLGVTRDITERKRAEQAITERNAQLALAGRAALVSSHAYDSDLETMTVSEAYAAIHGLPEGTTKTTRREWRARVHPEDLARLEEHRVQTFRNKRDVYNVDYRIVRASGDVRWIEARGIISYDCNGQPRRVIGINIDVTDRKRTEALLDESRSRLSDALAAGQVLAFEWDAATGQSQRSDNSANILGLEQDGIASSRNNFVERVHPDDRASLEARIRELRTDDASYALSFRYVRPGGGQVWLEETGKGEFDSTGRLLRIKGLTRDITERKNAELALAERNVQLALAAKAGLVGSYSYDPDTDTLQVSEGYAAIHGLAEGTKESTRSAWHSRAFPADRERLNSLREQAYRERRGECSAEYRINRAGEVRWIESRSFIAYSSDGRPQRVIGVNIDVTERKRAEERQRVLNAELDHRVKNILATVSAIMNQTQEASRSHADFVTGLNRRINSLARTHELLSESNWRGASLAEIVRREFAPYARGNTEAKGPSISLKAGATQAVAAVLHELTTNAVKYGALSNRSGRVSVRWRWLANGAHDRLLIEWQETGGPPVRAPSQSGYGTSIIRELIPFELGGAVELSFAPDGTQCRLEISGEWASKDNRRAEESRVSDHSA